MRGKYPDSSIVAYSTKGKAAAISAASNEELYVYLVRAYNRSGGAQDVGILRSLNSTYWSLFKLVSGTYTDITSSVTGATNIFTGSNNDGYVVQCTRRPGLVGFTISTAHAGGTYVYQYYNGSAFATLTTLEVPTDYSATGDSWAVFVPPSDWAMGGGGALSASKYSLKVVSTTGPGGAVAINNLWLGEFLELYTGVADTNAVEIAFPDSKPFLLNASEFLFPYFSVPNASNAMGALTYSG